MGGCRPSRKLTFLPSLDAPVPIYALFSIIGPTVDITFSTRLVTAASDPGNWFVRKNDQAWSVTGALAGASKVGLVLSGQVPNIGPDVVTFSPPPFDVLSFGGLVPAPAFTDYPLS